MLDTASILFSTLVCIFVVYRAVVLDGVRPWFRVDEVSPPDLSKDQPPSARPFATASRR